MRNTFGRTAVLDTVYIENATIHKQIPREVIPKLLKFSKPVHELVKVDVFLPGCPPSADTIFTHCRNWSRAAFRNLRRLPVLALRSS